MWCKRENESTHKQGRFQCMQNYVYFLIVTLFIRWINSIDVISGFQLVPIASARGSLFILFPLDRCQYKQNYIFSSCLIFLAVGLVCRCDEWVSAWANCECTWFWEGLDPLFHNNHVIRRVRVWSRIRIGWIA
ncbi:hypothetical protein VNO80_18120 [Phaseolus coccineus]|uniref:Uncharacterized protein n=1 Tax=Phaseolus coccineus TaxID=3886 RepID=A0AAN9MDY9_PHACN